MPFFVCPVCIATYEKEEIAAEYPCCPECCSDLPGDIEVVEYEKFLEGVTVEDLTKMYDSLIDNTKFRKAYREQICRRVKSLIEAKRT